MKETGLMFKAPLVRAILDDLKNQTRRIAKLPHMNPLGEWEPTTVGGPGGGRTRDGKEVPLQIALGHTRTGDVICAPIQPGDRIYVRETWNPDPPCDGTWAYTSWAGCRRGQIEGVPEQFRSPEHCMYAASTDAKLTWTPAIHMPKWAARIWLEVTGVRVERLQDISEADAKAEGSTLKNSPAAHLTSYRRGFQELWESTGGDWAANPWVWVIDFKRIEKP